MVGRLGDGPQRRLHDVRRGLEEKCAPWTRLRVSTELLDRLDEIFTRSFYSAAGYVFESQPYMVAEDADLLDRLDERPRR